MTSRPPPLAEALAALEAELRQQISRLVVGSPIAAADLSIVGRSDSPTATSNVIVGEDATDGDAPGALYMPSSRDATAIEIDSTTATPEDLIMATLATGVLPTSEAQGGGFDT
jgi:hypothetical protein